MTPPSTIAPLPDTPPAASGDDDGDGEREGRGIIKPQARATPTSENEQESPAGQHTDHSLLRLLREGDPDAATALYLRYANRLRQLTRSRCSNELAHRVEADDIVQSVFKSFFRKASDGLYDVPRGEELWKLFLVLTLNKIRTQGTYHRAARRDLRKTVGGDPADFGLADQDGDDDHALIELKLMVEDLLKGLPEKFREMVELRINGYEIAEIASRVGRSKRLVERVLQQFRAELKRQLEMDPDAAEPLDFP